MDHNYIEHDIFGDTIVDGSYATLPNGEHDDPLPFPLDIYHPGHDATASLETTFQDRSHWPYNESSWENRQALPSAVMPYNTYSPQSSHDYDYAYSHTTEYTTHDQDHTGATSPAENPALLYIQNDMYNDADGDLSTNFTNLDTNDDQPCPETLAPSDIPIQNQQRAAEAGPKKAARNPARRRNARQRSPSSARIPTAPTNARSRRGRRSSRNQNGGHGPIPCDWNNCTHTFRNKSELK